MTEQKQRVRSGPKGQKYWEAEMEKKVNQVTQELIAQHEREKAAMLAEYGDMTPGIPEDPNVAAEARMTQAHNAAMVGIAHHHATIPAPESVNVGVPPIERTMTNTHTPMESPLNAFKKAEAVKEEDPVSLFKNLYQITGRVRLTPRVGDPIVAEQTRLVWARSDTQAVEKFGKHFQKLSDANGDYQVLGAMVTEAIS